MRQRYAWIDARLASGEPFNRDDIVRAFTVTKQTASATISEYQALKSDALRYDGARKAFVRADQAPLAPRPKGATAALDRAWRAVDACGGTYSDADEISGYARGHRDALTAACREIEKLGGRPS